MRRNVTLISLLASLAGVLAAQPGVQVFEHRVEVNQGAGAAAAAPVVGFAPHTIQFMGAEMSGRPVKGAPYSAKAVTETTQVLADGNRIRRTMTASLYRDSEGRTRREQSLGPVGPLGPAHTLEMVSIMDPVAGFTYALDSNLKIAHKSPAGALMMTGSAGTRVGAFSRAIGKDEHEKIPAAAGGQTNTVVIQRKAKLHGEGFAPAEGTATWTRRVEAGAMPPDVLMAVPGMPAPFHVPFKNEDLGAQVIEGVPATGTRTVMTIAAGEIGNERPIEVVSERWYSAELQTVVMTKSSDPRSGEMVYRLTNISRSEPPRDLFEVPADYTIQKIGEIPVEEE